MIDTIFSNEEELEKGEIYSWIISKLEAAGWENIASNKTLTGTPGQSSYVDANCMYSSGSNGDQDIFIRISPFISSSGSATNNFITGTAGFIELGLYNGYTPGASGVNGVFDPVMASGVRASAPIINANTVASVAANTPGFLVRIGVTLDHFAVTIRPPGVSNAGGPTIFGAGIYYGGFNRYATGTDTVVWSNYLRLHNAASSHGIYTAASVAVRRPPVPIGGTAVFPCVTSIPEVPKSPNFDGVYTLSNITFGTTANGAVGIIPLIKGIQTPETPLADKSRILIGSKVYEVLYNAYATQATTLCTNTLAVRIQ
jgi:hypothetical protein